MKDLLKLSLILKSIFKGTPQKIKYERGSSCIHVILEDSYSSHDYLYIHQDDDKFKLEKHNKVSVSMCEDGLPATAHKFSTIILQQFLNSRINNYRQVKPDFEETTTR